ncbi:unnamed protein product [Blepharisma stoltei]|uniref:Thioredoxin domain-containing protein n=1 Tax=Blepharisma stoltei TaxID=1481888 RepID=A0AAU9IRX8_9CILI|nr:unnamed protein product [Blepharisma stoltei]
MFGDLLEFGSSVLKKASNSGILNPTFYSTKHYHFSGKEVSDNVSLSFSGKGNYFQISQLESQLSEEQKKVELNIDVAHKAGDPFPPIPVFKLSDGEEVILTSNDSKFYLYMFWMSWSPSSQEPMKYNQAIMERNPDWEGRVEVIAISIDDTRAEAERKMKDEGWDKISSYWAGSDSYYTKAPKSLKVDEIPTYVLAHQGKILWRGAPGKVDLEQVINEGLSGSHLSLPPLPLKPGDVCPAFSAVDANTEEDVDFSLADDNGKIYLINFWAIWSENSVKCMQNCQEILATHQEWADKFFVLGISIDSYREEIVGNFQDKGWNLIKNLWAGSETWYGPAPKALVLENMPYSVLVQNGKIVFSGDPSGRKLGLDLEAILKGEPLPKKYPNEAYLMSKDELDGKFEALKNAYEEFVSDNPYTQRPVINFDAKLTLKVDSEEEAQESFIWGEYSLSEKDAVSSLTRKIKDAIPEADIRLKFEPPAAFCERGSQCNLCNAPLTFNDTQYECLYCDPKHYHCDNCEKIIKEGVVGSAKFAHPHFTFVIHPGAQKLDNLRYGANRYDMTEYCEDKNGEGHCCSCDNRNAGLCDGTVIGNRYKCAHCPDFDYCQKCQERYETRDEKTVEWAESHGHLPWHIMIKLRMP